jgi:predicted enzyme related to lactoylglutathione lyase
MEPIGKIETVILNVEDVEKAAKFYSDLLGIEFEPILQHTISEGITFKSAWCPPYGFELIQQINPPAKEGVRGFTIRVADADKAKAEMAKRGFQPVHQARMKRANEHELVYNLGGFRFILTQHDDYGSL